MKKDKRFLVWAISIMIAATFWSLDGILIRPQFYQFSPINVVFIEHLLWVIVLSPFLFFWIKKVVKMKRKDFISLLWVCFFWGLIWTLTITEAFFSAYRWEATLSTIIILQKLQPVFALSMAAILLREKLSKRFYFWAFVSIVSAYFIAFGSLWKDIFNVNILNLPAFFAILAAFAFGSSTVFWKTLVNDLGFKLTTSLRFTLTSLLALVALFLFGDFADFWNFFPIHWQLLGVIVVSSWAGALFLYYFWLKKVSASSATIFELMWPLSAIFFDYFFNWKMMNTMQILGSIVLMVSFFMIILEKRKVKV